MCKDHCAHPELRKIDPVTYECPACGKHFINVMPEAR